MSYLGFTASTTGSTLDGTAVLGTVTTTNTTSSEKVLILANVGVKDANKSEIFGTILRYTGAAGASSYFNLASQTTQPSLTSFLNINNSLSYVSGDAGGGGGMLSASYIDTPGSQTSVSYMFYINHGSGGTITVTPVTVSLLKVSP
jgi:hypothetical protein